MGVAKRCLLGVTGDANSELGVVFDPNADIRDGKTGVLSGIAARVEDIEAEPCYCKKK